MEFPKTHSDFPQSLQNAHFLHWSKFNDSRDLHFPPPYLIKLSEANRKRVKRGPFNSSLSFVHPRESSLYLSDLIFIPKNCDNIANAGRTIILCWSLVKNKV